MVRVLFVVAFMLVSGNVALAEKAAPEVWEQESVVCELGAETTCSSFTLSPDGEYVAVWSQFWDVAKRGLIRSTLRLIRLADNQQIYATESEEFVFAQMLFTPDRQTIVGLVGDTERVSVWHENKGLFSPGNVLMFRRASDGGEFKQVDTGINYACVALNPRLYVTAVTPSGSQSQATAPPAIAVGGWPAIIRLYDVEGNHLYDLPGHDNGDHTWEGDLIKSLAFSPDGTLLASTGEDGTVRLWNLSDRTGVILNPNTSSRLKRGSCVVFSPDGQMLAAADELGMTIRRWRVTGDKVRSLRVLKITGRNQQGDTPRVQALAFSPDGTLLASGESSETIRLWSMATGKQAAVLALPAADQGYSSNALAFDASGRIFSGDTAGRVIIWRRAGETVAAVKSSPTE